MNRFSIIIPMLNEAEHIGKLFQHLIENAKQKTQLELIVVDGGSTDNSVEIVKKMINVTSSGSDCNEELNRDARKVLDTKFSTENFTRTDAEDRIKIILLNSKKGRAKQMNVGAKAATGTILYFLHADSFPPKHFDQFILNEIQKDNHAGCFRLKFDSNHLWLRLAGWFTKFNFKACRGGDQSLFVTKALFNKIGGFDESYIIYEDNIFISQLYDCNQFTVINTPIITSSRLYKKHGVFKLQYHFWMIYLKKWLGASAIDLHQYYKKHIS